MDRNRIELIGWKKSKGRKGNNSNSLNMKKNNDKKGLKKKNDKKGL